ncbi:MAG: MFS transporter [Luteitalea sp.]|nr:MFS transporter [Luteitalea sp.]
MTNRGRLFAASCVALVTTSMVFSIRGDILDALGRHFHLTNHQLGVILSPAFWGFTVSIMLGGSIVDFLGMRRLFLLSSAGYIGSVLLILFAPAPAGPITPYYTDAGFVCLYVGFLALGLSQGLVEGVINPLCATMYPGEKTKRFGILHAWWPGGLIIGGLAAYALTRALGLDAADLSREASAFGWRIKLALLLIPAVLYAIMIAGQPFPRTERVSAGVSDREMFGEALRPMFLLWLVCMLMTSSAELGPSQWVPSLITNLTGMQGILVLVYTAGLMFLLRFFGSSFAHRVSPLGLLTLSSILTAMGLFALAGASSAIGAFAAATLFGVGIAFYWPTMLSVTSERFPKGGAFLLAIVGGAGNLAVAFILPVIGTWYDAHGASAAFRSVAVLPIVLTVIFVGLMLYYRSRGGYRAIRLDARLVQD